MENEFSELLAASGSPRELVDAPKTPQEPPKSAQEPPKTPQDAIFVDFGSQSGTMLGPKIGSRSDLMLKQPES